MSIFTGSGVAIVTPFTSNMAVNYDKLRELIDFQINNGTDCIVICGTTGEASALSDDEHLECIRVAIDHTNKRVPVMAGTGSNDTAHGINLSKKAAALGADALLQVTPYYNKASQRGLIEHFGAIAKTVDIPIMLYNVPGRTGLNIAPATAKALLQYDNIVAIKEASGNISHVMELLQATQGDLDIYSGNDDQIYPLLALGGKGVVSVVANILPQQTHDIVALYHQGDIQGSLKLQLDMLSLINTLFIEVNPIPVKEALNLLGHDVGPLRLPLCSMEPQNHERLRQALIQYGMKGVRND